MKRKHFYFSGIFFLGLILCVFTGCSKDRDDEVSLLGEWVEESPVEGRTELYFYSANRVTMTTEGVVGDYTYRIVEESITLISDEESQGGGTEFYFRQINEDTFQIGNLHPSTPEDEPTFMIFVRKGNVTGDTDEA
ncbi:hypothetical protein GCM10007103_01150 [Salinimicrobium marinum]|uniref:Uncharacterized protein n=1 Tax=Salinimicrobium marinum TaxID=680283 RepID=A0A918S498_9FLAO|nr:hypothetical protein [Salinimicrobium marinum]GHA23802.1 hypothetical protein GCM10007103_01150 [Salinimicrobium marinum]